MLNRILKISCFLIFISTCSCDDSEIGGTLKQSHTIEFKELNESIKLEAKVWGVSGNHETVVLSSKNDEITFYTSQIFYQKKENDTLDIYVNNSAILENAEQFKSEVYIHLIELKNYDEIKELEKNHEDLNITMISAYQE